MSRNTEAEQRKVVEDDVLMWRGFMLYIVGEELRRAMGRTDVPGMCLGVEQPADPTHYMKEVVTLWKTSEWQKMKDRYAFEEQTFMQSDWGGPVMKPTTFAGNMRLRLPEVARSETRMEEGSPEGRLETSKQLARWAPGFMREVAVQLQEGALGGRVKMAMMSWSEHLQRGHTPFRRGCQVCQEAAARGRMDTKVPHPRAGILSLDVTGPFHPGNDIEQTAKFMLIGTYTWLRPHGGGDRMEGGIDEFGDHGDMDPGDLGPQLESHEDPEENEEEEVSAAEDAGPMDAAGEGVIQHEVEDRDAEDGEKRIDPQIEVLYVGTPTTGKSTESVMSGVIELYLQLRVDGFPVHTIHTDRGREFTNQRLRTWMRSRTIVQSTTGGEDPQANGRVERAVGETKRRLRRLLHGAGFDACWWPMGLRYLMETERIRRKGESTKVPAFGEKILVRKRIWNREQLEPTHEVGRYLTPTLEYHGHCILRENGRWGVAPYVIKNIQQPPPPTEQMWLALAEEAERDEMQERRRIRQKRPIREGGGLRLRAIKMMLKEEAGCMEVDLMENAVETLKKVDPYRWVMKKVEGEEEEILQTKIVGVQEMLKELPLWDAAIRSEIDSLFVQKEALKRITKQELDEIRGRHPEVAVLPAKVVITRKAGGRRKIRIVVCGNYAEKSQEEELYAGGSDTISLRMALKQAAQSEWEGATTDIKTAFLNAPLPQTGEASEASTLVLIAPPRLLVKLGYTGVQEYWMALKAMYGLRQSPRTWGDHRDGVFQEAKWEWDGRKMIFEPMVSDPNVWQLIDTSCELGREISGLMLVYVDDLLILGPRALVQSALARIKEAWDLSTPEWLNSREPVRFLGVDIWKMPQGMFMNQESYIKDVLKRNDETEGGYSGIPISKDQSGRLDEEEDQRSPEEIRLAQKATGELMWLGTRTRPDLMYVLSRMSQSTLKSPREVAKVGAQARAYLHRTAAEGIWLYQTVDEELEVYTDSSYGPGGLDSQGTVVVMWGRSPMMWKAGRQPSPALSTAESELSEAIEGLTMGDSVDVLLQEMVRRSYGRVIKVDNQAAVSLLSEPAGSWRTRHLRLRAAHLRWRLSRADWLTEAVPGSEQIADVGTKPMTAPKLREMRRMLGMGLREEESEARVECEKGAEKGAEDEGGEVQEGAQARGLGEGCEPDPHRFDFGSVDSG